nr:porin [uncultured Desulfuromonas sp.]
MKSNAIHHKTRWGKVMIKISGVLLLLTWSSPVLAVDQADYDALLLEVRQLRSQVQQMATMEQRLQQLETLLTAQQTTPSETTVVASEERKTAVKEVVEEVFTEKQPIHFGGAMRVNYGYKDWSDTQDDKYGDAGFDLFRIDANGSINDWVLSAQYRFYSYMNCVHHGYVGYNVSDQWQVQAGIHQVPFGLQPYASHNFWFSGAYYVGLEDDYDMGVKALYHNGPWGLALAFYKNDELASASSADRYSIDVNSSATGGYAGAQADGNEETNQFNARLTYAFDHDDIGSTEIGVSGQWGQLYNTNTDDTGDHWAAGVHLNGNYGPVNVQLEYASYAYDPENPVGMDDDIITMGAFTYSWGAPAQADIYIANVAYTIATDNLKWLDSITLYSDNTLIKPDASDQPTSWQNVVGALFACGPVYTYVDLISAENMIFSGGNMVDETVANNDERTTRLNVNIGYYW